MKKIKIVTMFVCLQAMTFSRAMEHPVGDNPVPLSNLLSERPVELLERQKEQAKQKFLNCTRQLATPLSSDYDKEMRKELYEEARITKMIYDILVEAIATQKSAARVVLIENARSLVTDTRVSLDIRKRLANQILKAKRFDRVQQQGVSPVDSLEETVGGSKSDRCIQEIQLLTNQAHDYQSKKEQQKIDKKQTSDNKNFTQKAFAVTFFTAQICFAYVCSQNKK